MQSAIEKVIAEQVKDPKSASRLRETISRRLQSANAANGLICVPLSVFLQLHRTFDSGQKVAYCGKKDGTNRQLSRSEDGGIYAMDDGREVFPFECLMAVSAGGGVPLTKFMQAIGTTGSEPRWVYDERGALVGVRQSDGSVLPKEQFDRRARTRTCIRCHSPATAVCQTCKQVYYCSTVCQRQDWPDHKRLFHA